jgi:hypothetical protein
MTIETRKDQATVAVCTTLRNLIAAYRTETGHEWISLSELLETVDAMEARA